MEGSADSVSTPLPSCRMCLHACSRNGVISRDSAVMPAQGSHIPQSYIMMLCTVLATCNAMSSSHALPMPHLTHKTFMIAILGT